MAVQLLAMTVGGGAAVTLIAQILKKTLGVKSTPVIHSLVVAVAALAALAQYFLALKSLPAEVLGISGSAIWGLSQAFYKAAPYLVKFLGQVQSAENAPAPVDASVTVSPTEAPAAVAPDTTTLAAPVVTEPADIPVTSEFNA